MLQLAFSWYDYALFIFTLSTSLLIGFYFGIIKKQKSANDYLLGGKEMSVVPVAMSMVASFVSGITILGVPSDVYKYGVIYWLCTPDLIVMIAVIYYIYCPVFYKLQIKSSNEYLKLRFNENIQRFSSAINTIASTFYLPIVIYVPALAISQATGFNIHLITPLICGVCIIYTTLGGLKAVVWADTLQFILMMVAIVTVFFIGTASTGGFSEIWRISQEHERLHIDLGVDLTRRDSLLSGTLGITVMGISYIAINQVCVQKCLSLPSYTKVKYMLILFALGLMAVISLCVFTGLIIFARYKDCDPLSAGLIKRPDQLLPYYILDVARDVPGLSGLFISGICSAALSTLAAVMNSMSCTIFEDFISRSIRKDISEQKISFILKCIAAIIGILNTVLVFVVEHMGGLLALSFSLSGVTVGTLLGLFTAGMLIPMANSIGVLWGGIVSMVTMSWIIFGQQWYQFQGNVIYPVLPLSVNGCISLTNTTETITTTLLSFNEVDEIPPALYRISFYWYALLGLIIFIIVTIPVSYFSKDKSAPLNRDLYSPIIHFLLPPEEKSYATVNITEKEANRT